MECEGVTSVGEGGCRAAVGGGRKKGVEGCSISTQIQLLVGAAIEDGRVVRGPS